MENKKEMNEVYVIEDKMFDLQWASGLISAWIPREWDEEEKAVVEKVFGKKYVTAHEERLKGLRTRAIENKTPLGMDIDEYLNDKNYVITDPYVKAQLEKASFENRFFGDKPVKFTKENAEKIKEYIKGKKK